MTISELIAELEERRRLYGDVEVYPACTAQIDGPVNAVYLQPIHDEDGDWFDEDDDDFDD